MYRTYPSSHPQMIRTPPGRLSLGIIEAHAGPTLSANTAGLYELVRRLQKRCSRTLVGSVGMRRIQSPSRSASHSHWMNSFIGSKSVKNLSMRPRLIGSGSPPCSLQKKWPRSEMKWRFPG
jgi:hypothetical protein